MRHLTADGEEIKIGDTLYKLEVSNNYIVKFEVKPHHAFFAESFCEKFDREEFTEHLWYKSLDKIYEYTKNKIQKDYDYQMKNVNGFYESNKNEDTV